MGKFKERRTEKNGLILIEKINESDGGRIARKEYYNKDGQLHRSNGPALVLYGFNGRSIEREEWWQDGKLSRRGNKPVIVNYWLNPKTVKEEYYPEGEGFRRLRYNAADQRVWIEEYLNIDDQLHRADGPAMIEYDSPGKIAAEFWYFEGRKHNDNGPAETRWSVSGLSSERYYLAGKLHRDSGPAVLNYDLDKLEEEIWYRHGKIHREDGPAYKKYMAERDINMFSETPEKMVVVKEEYYMFDEQVDHFVMDFSGTIKSIRKKRAWSVKDLADLCQVSYRTVEGWEQGRVPKNFIPLINLFMLHFKGGGH